MRNVISKLILVTLTLFSLTSAAGEIYLKCKGKISQEACSGFLRDKLKPFQCTITQTDCRYLYPAHLEASIWNLQMPSKKVGPTMPAPNSDVVAVECRLQSPNCVSPSLRDGDGGYRCADGYDSHAITENYICSPSAPDNARQKPSSVGAP